MNALDLAAESAPFVVELSALHRKRRTAQAHFRGTYASRSNRKKLYKIMPITLSGRVTQPRMLKVSECCDPEIRGRLGSLPTLSMSLGILISYVAGNWLYWRHLAFLSAAFCGALFVALLPMPESPMWLRARGLDDGPAVAWLHLSARATQTETPTDPNELLPFICNIIIIRSLIASRQ
ncbi:Facilitated trehalose transporter Tret1 [Eumeta japonica]|uniref:Facilitated trehalose transporter Tret1 n=1 Tax=Eumeta variegata TaxID=151549 RepID=A0A4C1VKM0_EUMVA|nr:Facilitated trehalose transporter Tret1 [Eumeta japonica]